jgi:hypothetical protein
MFIQIPAGGIICHYTQLESGAFAVVTPWHKILAPSFFELREQFEFHSSINGAGAWVVIVPRSTPASQAALF